MNRLIHRDRSAAFSAARRGRLPVPSALAVGQLRGTRLAIGWSLPVFAFVAIVGGWLLRSRPGDGDLPVLAGILAVSLFCGSALQGAVRLVAARLLGGSAADLTLHAFGAWGEVHGVTGWRRLGLALAAPVVSVAVAVCLASVPPGGAAWSGFSLVPPELVGQLSAVAVLSSCVWLLLVQAVAQTVPLPQGHGREMLVALVETAAPEAVGVQRQRLLRQLHGVVALTLFAGALLMLAVEAPGQGLPRWPFLMALAAAVWATRRVPAPESLGSAPAPLAMHPLAMASTAASVASTAAPVAIAAPVPPAQLAAGGRRRRHRPAPWLSRFWGTRRVRAAQRRERKEAVDAERLDAILDRLHRDGLDALPAEDRAVLQRVSERLRKMQRGSA